MPCKCALINDICPETNDRSKKKFCPNWKNGIPSISPEHGFMVYPLFTGCFLDIQEKYIIAMARDAAHAAAAFNGARDTVLGQTGENPTASLATVGLVLLGGSVLNKRLVVDNSNQIQGDPSAEAVLTTES